MASSLFLRHARSPQAHHPCLAKSSTAGYRRSHRLLSEATVSGGVILSEINKDNSVRKNFYRTNFVAKKLKLVETGKVDRKWFKEGGSTQITEYSTPPCDKCAREPESLWPGIRGTDPFRQVGRG